MSLKKLIIMTHEASRIFFSNFLQFFLAGRYFPKSPDIFPIYRNILPLKNRDIYDTLNISQYIGNISRYFGKYHPAKKICKKFEKNIFNMSRYIGNISRDFGKYRPAKKIYKKFEKKFMG